jgi:hypothetical protein
MKIRKKKEGKIWRLGPIVHPYGPKVKKRRPDAESRPVLPPHAARTRIPLPVPASPAPPPASPSPARPHPVPGSLERERAAAGQPQAAGAPRPGWLSLSPPAHLVPGCPAPAPDQQRPEHERERANAGTRQGAAGRGS